MISTIRHNIRSDVMGRTTRVFGARVLRSGRRVWTGPALEPIPEGKHHRHSVRGAVADGSVEVIEILDNNSTGSNVDEDDDDGDHKQNKNGWRKDNIDDIEMDMENTEEMEVDKRDEEIGGGVIRIDSSDDEGKEDTKEMVVGARRWGKVYVRRKRKREKSQGQREMVEDWENNDYMDSVKDSYGSYEVDVARKFGKQFVRRKRMRVTPNDVFVPNDNELKVNLGTRGRERRRRMLTIVVEACGRSSYWIISCFLNSVLRYLRRAELGLRQLYEFVGSEPIVDVYSACGIRFLQDLYSVARNGVCIISGARSSIPVFSVDFSALPFCFMYLHSSLHIRFVGLLHIHVTNSASTHDDDMDITGDEKHLPSIPPERDQAGCEVVACRNDHTDTMRVLQQAFGVSKLKNGRSFQKRRSSVRSKRGRPPSNFRAQKGKVGLASELFRSRHNRIQLSPLASNRQLRSSSKRNPSANVQELRSSFNDSQRNPSANVQELRSSFNEATRDIGAATCLANILVIESDKCFRVEGAVIALELSESKQWFLTVKKDGMTRYSIRAQKVMRPCNTNRFTHAMLWIGDNSWKLEFPDRQDWWIFKELYKKCFDRNLHTPIPSAIPVPRVCEVEGYGDGESVPFVRPHSYIAVRDDELTRALVKWTPNYDMDSDDEEWLNKFNSSTCGESDRCKYLSAEIFESMIDAFEKAIHSNPDGIFKVEAAYSTFPDLERRIVEAVYSHWTKRRKQNRSALIRIFQCYQPKKIQLFPKSIFRKKRSFKRQGSQAGRGIPRSFLQAMAVEQDIMERKNAMQKIQEAKTSATRSEGLAIEKRQRAQLLMETADLATYKAAMALRIAEAAEIAETTANHEATLFFLG